MTRARTEHRAEQRRCLGLDVLTRSLSANPGHDGSFLGWVNGPLLIAWAPARTELDLDGWCSDPSFASDTRVVQVKTFGTRLFDNSAFLAGFLPFELLWRSVGVAWAFLVGVALFSLVMAGRTRIRKHGLVAPPTRTPAVRDWAPGTVPGAGQSATSSQDRAPDHDQ